MYLDNLYKPIEYQGHRSKVKAIGRLCVGVTRQAMRSRATTYVCQKLKTQSLGGASGGLCSCNVKLAWIQDVLYRHGPRVVLSLEQGLTILFYVYFDIILPLPARQRGYVFAVYRCSIRHAARLHYSVVDYFSP